MKNKARRLWFVTELFYPEENATAYILTKIANYFTKNYEVNVICGPTSYDRSTSRLSCESELNKKIKVFRSNSVKLDKNILVYRILRLLIISFQLLFNFIKKVKKNESVFVVTNPAPLFLFISFFNSIQISLNILRF